MKISLCNEVIAGLDFAHQCALAAALGYDGLELAPYTLSDQPQQKWLLYLRTIDSFT